jgi:hypothetical protein
MFLMLFPLLHSELLTVAPPRGAYCCRVQSSISVSWTTQYVTCASCNDDHVLATMITTHPVRDMCPVMMIMR